MTIILFSLKRAYTLKIQYFYRLLTLSPPISKTAFHR